MNARRRSHRSKGYTLLELMVAVFTASVLSVGLSGSLYLATRTLAASDITRSRLDETSSLATLHAELREAKTMTSYTANQIVATLPDRTGDLVDDQVRYTWTGTPGAPLLRQINTQPTQTILPNVQSLIVDSRVDTTTSTSSTSATSAVVHTQSSSSSTDDREITPSNLFGQFFFPTLPTNAVSWRPTQVQVQLRKDTTNASGMITVICFAATGNGWPTGTMIGTGMLNINTWSTTTYALRSIPITSTLSLSPSQGMTFVIYKGTVPSNRKLEVQSTGSLGATGMMLSTDSGTSWIQDYSNELRHTVTAACEIPSGTTTTKRLRWLRLQVQSGANTLLTKPISVEILNRPIVP
jgi:Tfp pilus assembly protein PilV